MQECRELPKPPLFHKAWVIQQGQDITKGFGIHIGLRGANEASKSELNWWFYLDLRMSDDIWMKYTVLIMICIDTSCCEDTTKRSFSFQPELCLAPFRPWNTCQALAFYAATRNFGADWGWLLYNKARSWSQLRETFNLRPNRRNRTDMFCFFQTIHLSWKHYTSHQTSILQCKGDSLHALCDSIERIRDPYLDMGIGPTWEMMLRFKELFILFPPEKELQITKKFWNKKNSWATAWTKSGSRNNPTIKGSTKSWT